MESSERKLLLAIREQFDRLQFGLAAAAVDTGEVENLELLSMAESINSFINSFEESRSFVAALAAGRLDVEPPTRNLLASPFKHLHASLLHLTWQTSMIAKGDYSQRVDFMGDFSKAFNSMVMSLMDHEEKLQDAYEELQAQSEVLMAQSEELQTQNEELARLYEEARATEEALLKARDELESRVEERTRDLREKDRMLIQQSRMAAMGEMINNIAHQWRQPLNNIGLIIQLLTHMHDKGQLDRESLFMTEEQVMEIINHMSRTIDDFRDYFRPDKEKTTFSVNHSVEKTVSLVRASFMNRYIVTEILEEDCPPVTGYQNEYSQVLLNILQNAKDAFEARDVPDPKVTIAIGAENGRSVVTVTDNAGGIPEEILERIFDPYFTTKGPKQGTGVGLFMSRGIIEENMGGRLTVRNTGQGAEFRIEV